MTLFVYMILLFVDCRHHRCWTILKHRGQCRERFRVGELVVRLVSFPQFSVFVDPHISRSTCMYSTQRCATSHDQLSSGNIVAASAGSLSHSARILRLAVAFSLSHSSGGKPVGRVDCRSRKPYKSTGCVRPMVSVTYPCTPGG